MNFGLPSPKNTMPLILFTFLTKHLQIQELRYTDMVLYFTTTLVITIEAGYPT